MSRRDRKYFADLRATLDEASADVKQRFEGRPRAERRREARERLLPADRRCPRCGVVVLESRRWVVVDGVAICLRCWRTAKDDRTRMAGAEDKARASDDDTTLREQA
jgi:hypothetical protein